MGERANRNEERGWLVGFIGGLVVAATLASQTGLALSGRRQPAPRRDWKSVLARTWTEANQDQIPAIAAGITYFSLLAIFPAVSAGVALYGLVGDVAHAQSLLASLGGLLPQGAIDVIGDEIRRSYHARSAQLSFALALGISISLWSANAGIKALFAGLNAAYEAHEKRSFVRLNAESLLFTLGGVVCGLACVGLAGWGVFAGLGVSPWLDLLRWPLLFVAATAGLCLLYRYGPCRRKPSLRWTAPGAAVAALAWLGVSALFSWYASGFGNYDKTYGSLGAVIGFMTWIWLSMVVVLLGAELNSELEQAYGDG